MHNAERHRGGANPNISRKMIEMAHPIVNTIMHVHAHNSFGSRLHAKHPKLRRALDAPCGGILKNSVLVDTIWFFILASLEPEPTPCRNRRRCGLSS